MLDMLNALAKSADIKLSYWGPSGPLPASVENICTQKETEWLNTLLANGGIAAQLRSRPVTSLFTAAKLLLYLARAYRRRKDIDLYHINWLQNAIPILFTNKPALITALGSDLSLLKNRLVKYLFNSAISRKNIVICPNSDWMVEPLEKYVRPGSSIKRVYFGINEHWLKVKRVLEEGKVRNWLVILRITKPKIGKLFDWGKHIDDMGDELHLFGPMQENIPIPSWVHYHGPCHPMELFDNWFPVTYGIITLSEHAEGRPQILLDAMAAGIPVIASPLPAHIDLIIDKKTGFLVKSQEDFSAAYQSLVEPTNNKQIGDNAREWALQNIGTWNDCAARYISLYIQLLKNQ